MLLGDTAVGKTCLLVQFKDKTFLSGSFIPTVGIDFRVIDACKYLNHALQISAVHCQLLQRIIDISVILESLFIYFLYLLCSTLLQIIK